MLESGLLIAAETLVAAGVPVKKATAHVAAIRAARYGAAHPERSEAQS